MSGFPGGVYDADGKSVVLTMPDLLREQVDACPYRSVVKDRDMAPVALVWLLADDATPDAIPHILMIEAARLILAGGAILLLAHRPEPGVNVRAALLQALDLFTATQNEAGHA